MDTMFDNATKIEDMGRSLRELHAMLVILRDAREADEDDLRASVGAVVKSLSGLIEDMDALQAQLYQLE